MTAIITKERPAHAGLVDKHGQPIGSRQMASIALSGYRPEQPLIDLARDMPPETRHTVLFPAAARIQFRGQEIDRQWTPEQLRELSEQVRADFKRTGIAIIAGGAAGAWVLTNAYRTNQLNGTHDLDTDTHKIALFLSTSNLAVGSTTYAGVTNEHANANGYTTGGIAQVFTLTGTTSVSVAATASPTWTASGGSIVARWAAQYEVGGQVICFCLLDSAPADFTTTTGNTLTIATTAGVITAA